ncbi:MAG: transcription-repair coupling factor, partial [Lachnospiraceae bacterium]|nr:transcription-repair coupling factor [Lachnospiraceae bacterium]
MRAFTAPMRELGEFEEISQRTARNRGLIQVTGCIDSQKSHFVYCLADAFEQKLMSARKSAVASAASAGEAEVAARPVTLIITYNDLRAKEMYENYRFFNRDVLYFPAKDLIFFQADLQSNLLEQQRIQVLKALAESNSPLTIITTMAACMNRMVPFADWMGHIIEIGNSSELDTEALKKQLLQMGYERTGQVEGPGQFAGRGGIIDIFPLTEENPIRIELWGE